MIKKKKYLKLPLLKNINLDKIKSDLPSGKELSISIKDWYSIPDKTSILNAYFIGKQADWFFALSILIWFW